MHEHSLFPETSLLIVNMEYYKFIPKDKIPKGVVGFATPNVCECVCGFISSNEGYAFFHFFMLDDASQLAQLIKKDFEHATDVKIILIGGNPGDLFLPWKADNRNVNIEQWGIEGIDAVNLIKKKFVQTAPVDIRLFNFSLSGDLHDKLKSIIDSCIKEQNKRNLINYDYAALNTKIRSQQFQVNAFSHSGQFTVYGVKDCIAYQNLATVINALKTGTTLFNENNIEHYNSPPGFNVIAMFTGKCGSYSNDDNKWKKYSKTETDCKKLTKIKAVNYISIDKHNVNSLKIK